MRLFLLLLSFTSKILVFFVGQHVDGLVSRPGYSAGSENGEISLHSRLTLRSPECAILPKKNPFENQQSTLNSLHADQSRREIILATSLAILTGGVTSVSAESLIEAPGQQGESAIATQQQQQHGSSKPRSPLESLLPAMRFRFVLDKAMALVETASRASIGNLQNRREKELAILDDLSKLLLSPQNYTSSKFSAVPERPGQQYLDAYRLKRGELPLLEQPGALLQQNGEIGAWRRLKRQERAREEEDEIRAALNAYTNDLSFRTDSYLFNESKETKSRMIREDRVPDVKQVITSDLGLRYLYRNDVLTFMDDARSELRYLLKIANSSNEGTPSEQPSLDLSDLRELLAQADGALEKWFSLIDEEDVKKAKEVVGGF